MKRRAPEPEQRHFNDRSKALWEHTGEQYSAGTNTRDSEDVLNAKNEALPLTPVSHRMKATLDKALDLIASNWLLQVKVRSCCIPRKVGSDFNILLMAI